MLSAPIPPVRFSHVTCTSSCTTRKLQSALQVPLPIPASSTATFGPRRSPYRYMCGAPARGPVPQRLHVTSPPPPQRKEGKGPVQPTMATTKTTKTTFETTSPPPRVCGTDTWSGTLLRYINTAPCEPRIYIFVPLFDSGKPMKRCGH
jgi:hypothetical protein